MPRRLDRLEVSSGTDPVTSLTSTLLQLKLNLDTVISRPTGGEVGRHVGDT